MRVLTIVLPLCATLPLGCDAESSACKEQFAQAQSSVSGVDAKSSDSLKTSLALLERAHAQCEKAGRGSEREQLLKAKNELAAQLSLLEERAARKKRPIPTKEQLTALVKSGDPACPKGQAYQHRDTKQEVRCTGPQLVEMTSDALHAYYSERRFKVSMLDAPPTLKAELGSELYVFRFESLRDGKPRCTSAFAPPGMGWQELTSRLTGVAPEKLVLGANVRLTSGELAVRVEHPGDKPTVHLGQCDAP